MQRGRHGSAALALCCCLLAGSAATAAALKQPYLQVYQQCTTLDGATAGLCRGNQQASTSSSTQATDLVIDMSQPCSNRRRCSEVRVQAGLVQLVVPVRRLLGQRSNRRARLLWRGAPVLDALAAAATSPSSRCLPYSCRSALAAAAATPER
jgi:hypothetical protein